MPQKKIALINDYTGFGRCSVSVMAPIISAMKIQAVTVPTAILSAHTQFPEYFFDDYTSKMKDYIQTYKDIGLTFDAIATGFLGSEEQTDITVRAVYYTGYIALISDVVFYFVAFKNTAKPGCCC